MQIYKRQLESKDKFKWKDVLAEKKRRNKKLYGSIIVDIWSMCLIS